MSSPPLDKPQLTSQFREKLDLFCFFHLGSDARVEVREENEQIRILIRHHRVTPFEFSITYGRLQELKDDSPALERFMLEQITPHRR